MLLAIALAVSASRAPAPEMACWYSQTAPGQSQTRTVEGGFTITMRRDPNADAVEDGCRVEVRDRAGKVVFTREGFNTRLHPSSGRDVDNDGSPDLIVGTDTGGGNRCCWAYDVISLRQAPRVVATFSNPAFEDDAGGKTIIWQVVPFYDLGPSMAQSPTIIVAHQFRAGRLADITSEYCAAMLAGQLKGWADLSRDLENLSQAAKAASRAATGTRVPFEVEEARVSATTIALQMTYCGRAADAQALIRETWPEAQRAAIQSAVEKAAASARAR